MRGKCRIAVGFDGLAALQIERAGGELLNNRVVIAQLDTPDVLLRVVVVRVSFIEAIATPPDAFPVVELVGGPGLFGFVVDRQLNTTGRTEHVGFTTSVDTALRVPGDFLDAGNITGCTRTAVHAGD